MPSLFRRVMPLLLLCLFFGVRLYWQLIEPLPSPASSSTTMYNKSQFDVFIAGFAKCATTSLKDLLAASTHMVEKEVCRPFGASVNDSQALDMLDAVALQLPDNGLKAFKCPGGVKLARAIERMQAHSPQAKWIVGLRHPVLMLESYYNYRIANVHEEIATNITSRAALKQSCVRGREVPLPRNLHPSPDWPN